MEKLLLLFMISLSFSGNSQTNYTVTAYWNSWSNDHLTIETGDSVTFINHHYGNHNINGTTESFPFNPESFGMTRISDDWVYGHRFNTPGTYSFRCDLYPWQMGGLVIVEDVAEIEEETSNYNIYPNPAENRVHLTVPTGCQINIYDLLGNLVISKPHFNEDELDLAQLNSGTYLIEIKDKGNAEFQRIVKK
jgi:plastocyanin